jgi:apolipoprotein N-acyltransferase
VRPALRLAATAISALVFGLAFPPESVKPLAWIALVPWLVALRGSSVLGALVLAWLWGVLAAWSVGDWMPEAVEIYFLQPRWLGYLFFLGIATTMASVYYAGFALAYRALASRLGPLALPFATAAAWTAAELGRGRLFTGTPFFIGNPWGLLGYSQAGADAFVQGAALGGVYLLGFALAAVNAGVAGLVPALRRDRATAGRAALGAAASALPALLLVLYGVASLRDAPPAAVPAGDATPVAIVQGNVNLGTRWRSEFYGQNLDVYLDATREALAAEPAATVFWPEGALTFFLEDEPAYQRAIALVLAAGGAELVVGGPRTTGDAESAFFNTIFLLDPQGRLVGRYDKQFLVPFSEYFPFRRIDLLRRRFERVRTFTPGEPTAPLPTRAGPAGILTCNEAMLPEVAAARVAAGAALLVNPSNDTWIPSHRFAEHLFDIVRLRAVEQRRFLVRASTSGPSATIDPWGRIQTRSEPFSKAVLRGRVAARSDRTVYGRIGDAFAFACAAGVVVALVATRSGSRNRGRDLG